MLSSPYLLTNAGEQRYFDRDPVEHYRHDFHFRIRAETGYSSTGSGGKRMPTSVPLEPHENDVLLGRGGRNNQHSGNNILRQFARAEGENYRVASKKGKSALSRQLVRQMRALNPPARFLKRVQQTAAWEEVSEDTAREKASQVLRDAVAGLLEGKEEDEEDHEQEESTNDQPLRPISAPVSLDEQEPTRREQVARSRSADVHPPHSSHSAEISNAKRRRYSSEASTFHSYDQSYSSHQEPVVSYSPMIRRHSEHSYATTEAAYSDPSSRRTLIQQGTYPPHPRVSSETLISSSHRRQESAGNLDEFALLHGELLDSDVEDDTVRPPGTHSGAF